MRPFTRRGLALLLVLAVALSVLPAPVAADPRFGGAVVIAEGETVDGLEVLASSVVIRGTVRGDLSGAAGDIYVAPTGRITGDLSAGASTIRIAGEVGGDVSAGAASLVVEPTGVVAGELSGGASTVRIDGTVQGDVNVGAETVFLGPDAAVGGDVRYSGQLTDEGAAVDGQVVRDEGVGGPGGTTPPVVSEALGALFAVYVFLVNLVLGVLLLLVAPTFSRRVADTAIDTPLVSGGVGLLTIVVVPVVLVLIALTIIGIPLTIVGALLFALVAWVAAIYGRYAVGTWLVSLAGSENRWLALVVGLVVVAVATRIPILGGVIDFLVLLVGLGALALAATEERRARRAERATAEPEPEAEPDSDTGVPPA
jgi:cytoskeletal protein CcmA (bactofilin family)